MTCLKVRRLMPLAAGNDLRPRLMRAVGRHLGTCPDCREELASFRAALAGIKEAAEEEGIEDWSEIEWSAVMARVTAEAKDGGEAGGAFRFRAVPGPRWAAAAALGALAGLTVLGLFFRGPASRPGAARAGGGLVIASNAAAQDRLAITMVSPETGLQVVWFLDRNFDYKGE